MWQKRPRELDRVRCWSKWSGITLKCMLIFTWHTCMYYTDIYIYMTCTYVYTDLHMFIYIVVDLGEAEQLWVCYWYIHDLYVCIYWCIYAYTHWCWSRWSCRTLKIVLMYAWHMCHAYINTWLYHICVLFCAYMYVLHWYMHDTHVCIVCMYYTVMHDIYMYVLLVCIILCIQVCITLIYTWYTCMCYVYVLYCAYMYVLHWYIHDIHVCIMSMYYSVMHDMHVCITAYCIWSVIPSQPPISIPLVSYQQNVAKET